MKTALLVAAFLGALAGRAGADTTCTLIPGGQCGNDSDADGMTDATESSGDTDLDGTPDYLDTDSDDDGIADSYEGTDKETGAPADHDGDETPDFRDIDSDDDGVLDQIEAGNREAGAPIDTDGDGLADFVDPDSDDDGIPDGQDACRTYAGDCGPIGPPAEHTTPGTNALGTGVQQADDQMQQLPFAGSPDDDAAAGCDAGGGMAGPVTAGLVLLALAGTRTRRVRQADVRPGTGQSRR